MRAAHLKGGYIEYEYIGPTDQIPGSSAYKISVFQYLDCNTGGDQVDPYVSLTFFNLATNEKFASLTMPLSFTKNIQKTPFDCINDPGNLCYRIDTYISTIDIADNTNGYRLSVQRCCRIKGIVNVAKSDSTGITYTVEIPGTPSGLLRNASPVFAQEDTALACVNKPFSFPFKASDKDGDSLVYHFSAGKNTPTIEPKPFESNPPPFPDLIYGNGFTAQQPMGSNITINQQSGLITGTAPAFAGDYVVAVMVEEYRKGIKIGTARKEIHIRVGNCERVSASLPLQIINCNNFMVAFENMSASPSVQSYYWDFGVTNIATDTSTAANPVFTYTDPGIYTAKLIINQNSNCTDSATTQVRVYPGFEANYSFAGGCTRQPFLFTDKTVATSGSIAGWHWNFGDSATVSDTSIVQNDNYQYPAAGNYTVTFVATSSVGCIDTAIKIVTVFDKPLIRLNTTDTLICKGDSVRLQVLDAGNYKWLPAVSMVGENTSSPIVFPTASSTYQVTNTENGCSNAALVKINVVDFITVNAGADTSICKGDEVVLQTISDGTKYVWSPTFTLDNKSVKKPTALPTDSFTTYTVVASLGHCSASDSITITTLPYPFVNAGNDTAICFGNPVLLHGTSNAASMKWQPNGIIENNLQLISFAHPSQTTAFVLTVANNTGCTKPVNDTVLVKVNPGLKVFAGNDTTMVVGQALQLNAAGATNFSWLPTLGLDNAGAQNPTVNFMANLANALPEAIRYRVTGTTPDGCSGTDDITIRIFKTKQGIFIPSAFTPNNDGLNDLLRPVLAGIQQLLYFKIYDRYGQLVFETRQQGQGWDGTIKGQAAASGAFVYGCQAIDFTGKLLVEEGSFLLLR